MEWTGMPWQAPHIDHQQSPQEYSEHTQEKGWASQQMALGETRYLDVEGWNLSQLHKSTQNGFSPYP